MGSDADFVLVDLNEEYVIDGAAQFSASEYSPWDGWNMRGRVRATYLRGARSFSVDDSFPQARGKYVARTASGAAALASSS